MTPIVALADHNATQALCAKLPDRLRFGTGSARIFVPGADRLRAAVQAAGVAVPVVLTMALIDGQDMPEAREGGSGHRTRHLTSTPRSARSAASASAKRRRFLVLR